MMKYALWLIACLIVAAYSSSLYTHHKQRVMIEQIKARAESEQGFCGELVDTLKARRDNSE